jgi:hypothetical protein
MLNLLASWRTALRLLRGSQKDKLKRAADLYLELQFGWKPLASDISGALAAYKNPRKKMTRVSASATSEQHIGSVFGNVGVHPINYRESLTTTSEATVRIRGGVKVITAGHGRNLQAYGLMPQDFVVTIYELIPWSFLVDYFTDLGGVLGALTFAQSGIQYCSTTTVRQYKSVGTTVGLLPLLPNYVLLEESFSPQLVVWRKKQVTRSIGAPALPTPTVRLPKSLWQWANIAALTISRNYSRLRI